MRYEVKRYFSSFVTFELEADSEEEAYVNAKKRAIDLIELHNNLEDWEEANEITKLQEDY